MRRSRSLIPAPSLEVGQQCDLGLSLAQECELRNNLCHAMALADPSQVVIFQSIDCFRYLS